MNDAADDQPEKSTQTGDGEVQNLDKDDQEKTSDETLLEVSGDSVPSSVMLSSRQLTGQFGRYRIERTLGKGSMGTVYLAHDGRLDRLIALKAPHFKPDEESDVIDRFYREARSMATVQHPNLCPVHDVGEINGVHFLTMAHIDGSPLSDIIKQDEPIADHEAVQIIIKMAIALEAAHQAGVIHRDLKPSNVMIDQRGEPVIMDFGLARREKAGESTLTHAGAIMGTPAYMSPEQVDGDPDLLGPAADVYSLGVVLYELISRQLPFQGSVTGMLASIVYKDPPKLSDLRKDVDSALEAICMTAMAKKPEHRFASMLEFSTALQSYESNRSFTQSSAMSGSQPSFVSGFKHDIFVSFALADDEPPPGQLDGWITTLITNLTWRLRQLCGRTDVLSVCFDRNLSATGDLATDAIDAIRESATIVLVVSPGFLNSNWCRQDAEKFFAMLRDRIADGSSVVVVEHDRVESHARHEEFAKMRTYQFWEDVEDRGPRILGHPRPNPDRDFDYYERIDDLARDLYAAFGHLENREQEPSMSESEASSDESQNQPTSGEVEDVVYLAEVTDDLDPLRDEVRRYLDQCGYRVKPEIWYSREPDEFQQSVESDLSDCVAFVQLLGQLTGKKHPGTSSSYSGLQHQTALKVGKPVLQWRDAGLDLDHISDPDHRELLLGSTVTATDIEEFKREVARRIQQEIDRRDIPEEQQPEQDQAFVFINVDHEDLPLADDICDLLDSHGCSYAMPMHEGRPDEVRQDLEANLLDCDGLIVVYGDITEQWVREQLRQWRKILYRREKPLRALAVYEGPPQEKHRLGMKLPKMHVIDCRNGIQEDKVLSFLNALADN